MAKQKLKCIALWVDQRFVMVDHHLHGCCKKRGHPGAHKCFGCRSRRLPEELGVAPTRGTENPWEGGIPVSNRPVARRGIPAYGPVVTNATWSFSRNPEGTVSRPAEYDLSTLESVFLNQTPIISIPQEPEPDET